MDSAGDGVMVATQADLLAALRTAHEASALRGNPSHEALKLATLGSGSYVQAITAALMTLGGAHAPLVETCRLLEAEDPCQEVHNALMAGQKVPGWGSGFVKGGIDPLWREVDTLLHTLYPARMGTIDQMTDILHAAGKLVYPNPSCYTACVAVIMGLAPEASPYLFVSMRLPKWTEAYCRAKGVWVR